MALAGEPAEIGVKLRQRFGNAFDPSGQRLQRRRLQHG